MENLFEDIKRSRSTHEESGSLNHLPKEVLIRILSMLPIHSESMAQCRCVCKTWRTLINDPLLAHLSNPVPVIIIHKHSPIRDFLYFLDLPSLQQEEAKSLTAKEIRIPAMLCHFDLRASCNGLLCLREYFKDSSLHVCNPFTRDYIQLPESAGDVKRRIPIISFGFDPKTMEYKVCRITKVAQSRESEVQILTIGRGTWRFLRKLPYWFRQEAITPYVNGRLHWITSNGGLISLDLETEEFIDIPTPDWSYQTWDRAMRPVVFQNRLSIMVEVRLLGEWRLWIMDEYGKKESWREAFRFRKELILESRIRNIYRAPSVDVRVVGIMENGEVLLEYCDARWQYLVLYDPISETSKRFIVDGLPANVYGKAVVHMASPSGIPR
ncbi:hypothetical protein SLA2020_059630 [Shorea laevis]